MFVSYPVTPVLVQWCPFRWVGGLEHVQKVSTDRDVRFMYDHCVAYTFHPFVSILCSFLIQWLWSLTSDVHFVGWEVLSMFKKFHRTKRTEMSVLCMIIVWLIHSTNWSREPQALKSMDFVTEEPNSACFVRFPSVTNLLPNLTKPLSTSLSASFRISRVEFVYCGWCFYHDGLLNTKTEDIAFSIFWHRQDKTYFQFVSFWSKACELLSCCVRPCVRL